MDAAILTIEHIDSLLLPVEQPGVESPVFPQGRGLTPAQEENGDTLPHEFLSSITAGPHSEAESKFWEGAPPESNPVTAQS